MKKYCSWNKNKDVVFVRETKNGFSQSKSKQEHVHKTLYEDHYRSCSPAFSVYVQQMGQSGLKMRGRHSNHSHELVSFQWKEMQKGQ